ncbi:Maf family protein [Brevibacterium daeguense]|uniref:Nucleoside triphosphate pyrophosphatase n=1 Tax=Brevibacterium daeguense TaxID=909936 RepID=A0ABP8EMC7_9MICO
MTTVVLASASPARRRILEGTGITPQIIVSDVDEDALEAAHPDASVPELAALLARAKGEAVIERICADPQLVDVPGPLVLLASDSILELAGRAVGKPHTAEATRTVWRRMGGAGAHLHTGHFAARLERTSGWRRVGSAEAVGTSVIHTAAPTSAELEAYIATEEPFEVAGALTIDGYGGAFVTGIEGDHNNVIGLSLPLVRELVTSLGFFWPSLWDVNR